ncbi:Uncharacterised protein [BD1-7 clade bacterium]|uniref:Capsule polysaccharide biosynthesis protein n=1 Tax=BD1-7 clade bacterium TaxID=2029982 RepID=A0A5S9R065_9GAMM|nr:Uncharacterised protein [BD1-7 clade bacterium]
MILFFQSRRDLGKYFAEVIRKGGFEGEIYTHKQFGLPSLAALIKPDQDVIRTAVNYRLIDKSSRRSQPVSAVQRFAYQLMARFRYASDVAYLQQKRPELAVVWNGLKFRQAIFVGAARSLGIKCCFMENGLLPDTTVCDEKGINAGNSLPRDAGFYRSQEGLPAFTSKSLNVRAQVTDKISSESALPERYIFVPFQVDSDSQIVSYSPWIKNMAQLSQAVVDALPSGSPYKIVFKEHPSSYVDYDYLHTEIDGNTAMFANGVTTQTLIENADAVITINSTVGIEALSYGKKVIVLGEACYAIPEVVLCASNQAELVNAIACVGGANFDSELREHFLAYLQTQYHVQGDWRKPDEAHFESLATRLKRFL